MKALEKAAKDRSESAQAAASPELTAPVAKAPPGSAPIPRAPVPAASSKMELALEPLSADAPPVHERTTPPAATPNKPSPGLKTGEQARAAAVLQATANMPLPAPFARRFKPIVAVSILAGLAVIGFGIYVFLQITNPGLFIRQAPPAPKPAMAQTPVHQYAIRTGRIRRNRCKRNAIGDCGSSSRSADCCACRSAAPCRSAA